MNKIDLLHLFAMSMEPISGSRTYVGNLVRSQKSYANVTLMCRYDRRNMKLPLRIIPLRMHKFYSWRWYDEDKRAATVSINTMKKAVRKFLRENRTDLVNIQHLTYSLYGADVAKKEFGLPVVAVSHGTCIYQNHNDEALMDCLVDNVDSIIAVSRFVKRYIIENVGISPHKIHVTYPGVDYTLFNRRNFSNEMKTRYGDFALFFGRVEEEKGVYMLKDIAKLLPKEMSILVAGKEKTPGLFERDLRKAKMSDRVRYIGYVSLDDLKRLIATAKTVVMPSISEEPFASAYVETLASGTPIVVSKRGGSDELPSVDGVVRADLDPSSFAAGILKVSALDGKTRDNLEATARKMYSWKWVSNRYREIYDKLLGCG